MADKNLDIRISANPTQAVGALGAVEKGLDATSQQAKDAGKSLGQVGQGGEQAGAGLGKTRQGIHSVSEALQTAKTQLASFLAAQLSLGAAKEVLQTADSYSNLQAKIKLATGEGAAFKGAFEEVVAISRRTNSNLEETGQLFAKLTESGKSAGLQSQQAIQQALGLTETINQAIQLSGGSASSAAAAITQLVQGLQGGALRGDEFNSVMEQSPRLAKALADGLGVTTGELRKMAEAGALTSSTVITALRGQASVLQAEFASLPPTVGRAIENLSTSWTVFVGETDKATGVSKLAAEAIDGLARNLGTLAGYLVDAGQVAAGLMALKLAQHFTAVAAAATASTAAVTANTAAVAANATASNVAATGAGRFASVLAGLKTLSLVGLVTNFHDIGTAIGEGIAKLGGWKDKTDEIARAEKTAAEVAKQAAMDRQRLADLTQIAVDKQFELGKSAKAAAAEFDQLREKGEKASEALINVTKDFDVLSVEGVKNFGAVLDKLTHDGKVGATQIRAAFAEALEGKDLAVFETNARAAFAGSAREAEKMGMVLDAVGREAVRRTGVEFDVLQGRIGAASRSAINDVEAIVNSMDRLQAEGVDVGRALALRLSQAIDSADSQRALDLVKDRVESLRSKLGETVTNGLLEQAAQKAQELVETIQASIPGIQGMAEAMKQLGVTSDEHLRRTAKTAQDAYEVVRNSGTASTRELSESFRRAAEAAIAASKDGIVPSWVLAEAAARGYTIQVDETGRKTLQATSAASKGATELGRAWRGAAEDAASAAAAAERLREINERHSAPKGTSIVGSTREERLAGQGSLDLSNQFTIRDKLSRGALTAADLPEAMAVLRQLDANEAVNRTLNPGAFSADGLRDRQEWNAVRAQLSEAISRLSSAGGGALQGAGGPAKTVNVRINGGGPVPTTEEGSQNLIRALQAAKLGAGG